MYLLQNSYLNFKIFHTFIYLEAEETNTELSDLMEQFREQATKLIDMLDLSVPAVVRLKVFIKLLIFDFLT